MMTGTSPASRPIISLDHHKASAGELYLYARQIMGLTPAEAISALAAAAGHGIADLHNPGLEAVSTAAGLVGSLAELTAAAQLGRGTG